MLKLKLHSKIWSRKNNKGFTLIELLVVVGIIGILSSIVLFSLSGARSKSRDTIRRSDLRQLANASEIKFSTDGSYPNSTGWITEGDPINTTLVPTYISKIPLDPGGNGNIQYQYWRKDYSSGCFNLNDRNKYAVFAKLENPTAADLATIQDAFDQCASTLYGMNYKVGN